MSKVELANVVKVGIVNTSLVWDAESKKWVTETGKIVAKWAIMLFTKDDKAIASEVYEGFHDPDGLMKPYLKDGMKRSRAIVLAKALATENGWNVTKVIEDDFAMAKQIVDGEEEEAKAKKAARKAEKENGTWYTTRIAKLASDGAKKCQSKYVREDLRAMGAKATKLTEAVGESTAAEFDAAMDEMIAARKAKKAA